MGTTFVSQTGLVGRSGCARSLWAKRARCLIGYLETKHPNARWSPTPRACLKFRRPRNPLGASVAKEGMAKEPLNNVAILAHLDH